MNLHSHAAQGGMSAKQRAEAQFERDANIVVDSRLLDDLAALYADEALPNTGERESFVERLEQQAEAAVVRATFVTCVLAVNAALRFPDDDVFMAYLGLLDLPRHDDSLLGLKRFIIRKLAADADDAVTDEARFRARVTEILHRVV